MSYFVRNQEFAFGIDLSRYNASADLTQMPDFEFINTDLSALSA